MAPTEGRVARPERRRGCRRGTPEYSQTAMSDNGVRPLTSSEYSWTSGLGVNPGPNPRQFQPWPILGYHDTSCNITDRRATCLSVTNAFRTVLPTASIRCCRFHMGHNAP